jgi:hypothetical protein
VALYERPRLLLIDEIGSLSYSNRHADLLFEIVSRRYQEKSTLLTTNRPFSEWGEVFPNAACVLSLLDRLVHNAEIIQIEGESHRLKEAKERSEARRKGRAARKRKSPPSPLPMTDCSPTEAPMFPNSSIPPLLVARAGSGRLRISRGTARANRGPLRRAEHRANAL